MNDKEQRRANELDFVASRSERFWQWFILIAAVVGAIVLICLGGCTEVDKKDFTVKFEPEPETHQVNKYVKARIFYLNDGTRCVALFGDSVGLDCEWLDRELPMEYDGFRRPQ